MLNKYTIYETSQGKKIVIHNGTGYYETFPKQSFYRAVMDIIGYINCEDERYYYITTELQEKIKLCK